MNTLVSNIHINESALKHNLRRVHESAPNAKVLAMLKANAYGHGIVRVAKALAEADAFGVACLSEAIQLRESNISNQIVLMRGVLTKEELALALQYQIDLVIHHPDQALLLEQQTFSSPLSLWLKINTGMNRLGIPPEDVLQIYLRLSKLTLKTPIRLMSHFACADEKNNPMTMKQIQLFKEITQTLSAEKSLANSAGILAWPESHLDWVRPGLMLYGVSPFEQTLANEFDLKPAMTWTSELIAVRFQKAGDVVGYGSRWLCPHDGLIGIVGVGYADGYPRHAKNETPVLINQEKVKLIGRVSMDMLALDLRTKPNAKPGDIVTLWGEGLPIEIVAENTATNAYELLCNARIR